MEQITEDMLLEAQGALDNIMAPTGGLPQWAIDEYMANSVHTFIASVTGGMIGSIYFEDGRLRTTHGSGPVEEKEERNISTVRCNIHLRTAFVAYQQDKPREVERGNVFTFAKWLDKLLKNTPIGQLPGWVERVDSPADAKDFNMATGQVLNQDGTDGSDQVLFEIFKKHKRYLGFIHVEKLHSIHPSRGTAAKIKLNDQMVSALKKSLQNAEEAGRQLMADDNLPEDDPNVIHTKNQTFYDSVAKLLPSFVQYIRHPNQI